MAQILHLDAPRVQLDYIPELLYKLRWRFEIRGGMQTVSSAWTPETKYPSLSLILKEYAGLITQVFIDVKTLDNTNIRTCMKMPGKDFKTICYKAIYNSRMNRTIVAGIQLEDISGNIYLILRDGNYHIESKKKG